MSRTPIHPGEHLAEELTAIDMSPAELGRQIKVPTTLVTEVTNGGRDITGEMALRIGHVSGTSAEMLLNLQNLHEMRLAEMRVDAQIATLPSSIARAGQPFGGPPPRVTGVGGVDFGDT
jgi:addiction module HigA family antidote